MSSSSTSSFEQLAPEERVRRGRVPVAALVFVVMIAIVEGVASAYEDWLADTGSWTWAVKRSLLDEGALTGDVAVFGSSVLLEGLDPTAANQLSPSGRVVNLGLLGMMRQHQVQLFRERMRSPSPPRVAILEFRDSIVTQDSWEVPPYFRFAASWSEFLESRFYYWNPSLALGFFENRLSTVFRHREAVAAWLLASARGGRLSVQTRDRNRIMAADMRGHHGWARPEKEDVSIEGTRKPNVARPWSVNAAGELWLRKFMDVAAAHNVKVVLFLTPAPPPPRLVELLGPQGFRARFNEHVTALRQEYPGVAIEVFEPRGFLLEDFGDDIHVSPSGREKLSRMFAEWMKDYRARHGL